MIVSAVRSFVEKEVYPLEREVEKTGIVPREIADSIKQKCKDAGFYAANIPAEAGGGGLCNLDFALLERELGRGAMALTVFFRTPVQHLNGVSRFATRQISLSCSTRRKKWDALAMTETRRRFRCARNAMRRRPQKRRLDS